MHETWFRYWSCLDPIERQDTIKLIAACTHIYLPKTQKLPQLKIAVSEEALTNKFIQN